MQFFSLLIQSPRNGIKASQLLFQRKHLLTLAKLSLLDDITFIIYFVSYRLYQHLFIVTCLQQLIMLPSWDCNNISSQQQKHHSFSFYELISSAPTQALIIVKFTEVSVH